FFMSFLRPPLARSPLFPYTTLFRSIITCGIRGSLGCERIKRRAMLGGRVKKASKGGAAGVERTRFGKHSACHEFRQALGESRIRDRKSTRLNSSHLVISYAVFCLKK